MKVIDNESIPELRTWMNPTQVGEELGVARMTAFRMMKRGELKTVHWLGSMLVVRRAEVDRLKAKRDSVSAA